MTPVESARAEVEKLNGFETGLGKKWRASYERLVTLQEASGDELLAATEAGSGDEALTEIAGRMARVQSEIEAYVRAIVSARARRRAAILQAWKAEASDLRSHATELRAEALERQKKTDAFLEKLRAFEQVTYVVGLPVPLIGTHLDPPQIPITQQLRDEAQRLDAQAAQLEARPVIDSGEASGASVEDLIAAVSADPMRIAPSIPDVLLWAEPALADAARSRSRRTMNGLPDESPITLELRWKGGAIDPTASRAYLPPL